MFCLYLVLLLVMITLNLYALLTGMNMKTEYLLREINLALFCLLIFATLYNFCNYAHYFANIVRYQNILFEYIYVVFLLRYRPECKSRSFE